MDSLQAGPHGKAVIEDGWVGGEPGCWWYWYPNMDAPILDAPIDLGAQVYALDPEKSEWRLPLDNPFTTAW